MWASRNALHGTLDMALREEESRMRTGQAAHNMTVLCRWALHLLRQGPTATGGSAAPRNQAGRDENCLLQVLSESLPMQDAMALTGLRRHGGGRDGCAIIPAGGRGPGVCISGAWPAGP